MLAGFTRHSSAVTVFARQEGRAEKQRLESSQEATRRWVLENLSPAARVPLCVGMTEEKEWTWVPLCAGMTEEKEWTRVPLCAGMTEEKEWTPRHAPQ